MYFQPESDDLKPGPAGTQARLRGLRGLLAQTETVLDHDLDAARERACRAEALARELGANGELAIALLLQGKLAFFEERIDDALQLAQRAASLAESEGQPAARTKTLTGLCAMWASLGLGEQALPHLEAAAEQLAGSPDAAGLAFVQSLLGGVLAQTGHAERGREQLEQALASFTQLGLAGRAREARHNLACLAHLQGRHAIALAMADISGVEALRERDWMHAHIEATACDALVGLGRAAEGVQRVQRAVRETPDPARGAYDLQLALGRAALAAGLHAEARQALESALAQLESGGRPDDPTLFEALAALHRQLGDEAAAHAAATRAAAAHAGRSGDETLRWRLQALRAGVELQAVRLRYGRMAAERARLSAQLEHSRRLLAAEAGQRPELLDDGFGATHPAFDPHFDGEAAGYTLRYQPLVDLADGRIVGYEALLRLATRPGGRSAPLEFVRRLEASGEIGNVGHWVLRRACEDLVALQRAAPRPLRLVVNVSRRELERAEYADDVLEVLSAAGLPPGRLELDLDGLHDTEHAELLRHPLQRLRGAGIGITLENFGHAQLPLSLLAELPLSKLKIDRSLVAALGHDERHDVLFASILQTAANLRLAVGVVGIENDTQWRRVRQLGCAEGQGFLFATPLPLPAALHLPLLLPAAAD
jgi:EAL domain-containing protein (putative c-di-GMP-specific phosphodiesterase class I)